MVPRGGRLAVDSLVGILERNGISINQLAKILDFGCGCGRVLRHLRAMTPASLFGTDTNRELVGWCKANLDFAHVSENGMRPPLPYDTAEFALIYALSVFTHLPLDLQFEWMRELARVLAPEGFLVLSAHGEHYLPTLTQEEQERFRSGSLVVQHADLAGSNACGAFHPESFMRTTLAPECGFTVKDFVPRGASGNPHQDLYLLQRTVNQARAREEL